MQLIIICSKKKKGKKGKKILYQVQKTRNRYTGKRKFININLLTKINSQNQIKLINNINKV